MGQVQSAAGLDYDDDPSHTRIWELNVRKMNFIKAWWQAKESAQNSSPPTTSPARDAAKAIPMALSNETWLNDMFMLENFQFENYDFQTDESGIIPSFGL